MKIPKVSVIVPIYNAEKFLLKCLSSMTEQTLKDIEIICVNDGSTDKSLSIMQEYAKKDKRIKIINQKNQGLSSSRNNALRVAKGEYISFMDADDYANDCFLESLYNAAVKHEADVAVGNIVRVEEGKKDDYVLFYNKTKIAHKTDDIFRLLNIPKTCYVCNRIYKRNFVIENNLFFKDGAFFEDIVWSPLIAANAKKVVSEPRAKYYYVYNSNSIVATTEGDPKKYKDRHEAYLFYNNFIKEHKIKAPCVWEKITKIRFLGLPLFKVTEMENYKKSYYFCGIKFASGRVRKQF